MASPSMTSNMYVDDLLLQIESSKEVMIQPMVEIIKDSLANCGIKVSSKSKVLTLSHRKPTEDQEEQIFAGFQKVQSLKWLGYYLDHSLSVKEHLKYLDRKLSFLHYRLKPLLVQLSAFVCTREIHFVIYLFINLYQFIKFIYYIFPLF